MSEPRNHRHLGECALAHASWTKCSTRPSAQTVVWLCPAQHKPAPSKQLEPARRHFAASGGEETRLARCDGRSSAHE
jgi:hypothetical protein